VEFAPSHVAEGAILAVGLESGEMAVMKVDMEEGSAAVLGHVPADITHDGTVRRIRWQPAGFGDQARIATASSDKSLRFFTLRL
jgi:hypothetical protein